MLLKRILHIITLVLIVASLCYCKTTEVSLLEKEKLRIETERKIQEERTFQAKIKAHWDQQTKATQKRMQKTKKRAEKYNKSKKKGLFYEIFKKNKKK